MQSQNRIFDDLARLMANAAGAAQGVREEIEVLVRSQIERLIAEFNLVTREEFDAVRAIAIGARDEADRLAARLAALEAERRPATAAPSPEDDDTPLEPSL